LDRRSLAERRDVFEHPVEKNIKHQVTPPAIKKHHAEDE